MKRVAVLGDSTTCNIFLTNPDDLWTKKLGTQLAALVHNFGAPGMWVGVDPAGCVGAEAIGPAAWQQLSQFYCFDGVIVLLGVNAKLKNVALANFSAGYAALLAQIPTPNRFLCAMSPLWTTHENTQNGIGLRFADYRQAVADVAAATPGVLFIQGNAILPHLTSNFLADGIHPSIAGNDILSITTYYLFKDLLA